MHVRTAGSQCGKSAVSEGNEGTRLVRGDRQALDPTESSEAPGKASESYSRCNERPLSNFRQGNAMI